jgi:hypothetical protein
MFDKQPVIVGGNGHSGTRVFIEIIGRAGVFSGVRSLTKRSHSEDLRIIDLLNRWVDPYIFKTLDEQGETEMKRAFARRLRLYFPLRHKQWAFKNPRCMLILPVLHQLFPGMKFVHVIRDGRDISLGNAFVASNRYVDAFLAADERSLPPEHKMILFWGRSNQQAMEYGTAALGDRYTMMRWEDLCLKPLPMAEKLIRFAGGVQSAALKASQLVEKPSSIGRWASFPPDVRDPVEARGRPWLSLFGYD